MWQSLSGVQEPVARHVGQRVPYGFGAVCLQQSGVHQRKAEWLESKPCRDCERKALREENLAEAAELTGSDKQIAWANDLRAKAIAEVKRTLSKLDTTDAALPQKREDTLDEVDKAAIIAAMLAETSAKTIIDNRYGLVEYYNRVAQQAAK